MADVTWVFENLAVGGGIFTREIMEKIASLGVTHILDGQAEFDDTPLADGLPIEVCWCPAYDNFDAPDEETLEVAAQFIEKNLVNGADTNRMLIHCAGGVHRGPMFTLLACMMCEISVDKAMDRIDGTRLIASFPAVYRKAVEDFVKKRNKGNQLL